MPNVTIAQTAVLVCVDCRRQLGDTPSGSVEPGQALPQVGGVEVGEQPVEAAERAPEQGGVRSRLHGEGVGVLDVAVHAPHRAGVEEQLSARGLITLEENDIELDVRR